MSGEPALAARPRRRPWVGPGGAGPAAALAPGLRPGLVPRPRLVRRLMAARDVPMAAIVAPAGYGKTTLLVDWSMRDDRPFAWLSLASSGDDAGALRAALDEVGEPAAATPRVVVLDDVQRLADPESGRAIGELAGRLPPGSTLALASRRELPLPTGRLRAERALLELGPRHLAMTRLEAAMLLSAAGLRLDGEEVDRLLERTQGWPAGLSLAAQAVLEQPGVDEALARFAGDDRLVADYLRAEVLADWDAAQLAFARRTSILSRLTPGLCDAVLEARGSAATLRDLSRGNMLVEPLDRCDREFRYHPLLVATLRAELAREEPELEPALHRRAADWHTRHGDVATALRHAVDAHDAARAGRLLWSLVPACAGSGRAAPVSRWLEPFGAGERSAHASLALATATYHLAEGSRDQAEYWTHAAECAPHGLEEEGERRAAVALLRACVARDGVRRMGEDARAARALAAPASGWLGLADYLMGVARHLTGDRELARRLLEDGARRSASVLPLVDALCRAQLALLAVEREDLDDADRHSAAARAAAAPEAPLSAPVHAIRAFVAAQRGDLAGARRAAADAQRTLAALAGFVPWHVAEVQIWLARAQIRLSDAAPARVLLARAARLQNQAPDAPVLWAWLHDGWERADAFAAGATGERPSLTTAELRVLRFLPSHLSFREIGAQLHVSPNTVKTQALAVYRKLDVTCRSDAVGRGRAVGLIDG